MFFFQITLIALENFALPRPIDLFKNKLRCENEKVWLTSTAYESALFNRILHLLEERPAQGKRMIGLGPLALWELWQRLAALEQAARQERAQRADRKRQAGGGRKKDGNVLLRFYCGPAHAMRGSDRGQFVGQWHVWTTLS